MLTISILTSTIGLFYTITLTLLILFLLNVLLLLQEKRRNFRKLRDDLGYPIPPLSNPFYGHMDEIGRRDKEFKWHKELGKVFGVYNNDLPMLKIADPNLVNEVFLKQSKLYNSRVWHEYRLLAIKRSILLNMGEDWRKIRRIIRPALAEYRVKPNDTHIHDIKCGLDKLVNLFKGLTSSDRGPEEQDSSQYSREGFMSIECSDSPTGLALDVNAYDVMQVVTLDVIFRLAFNLNSVDVTKGADDENLKIIRSIMGCVDSAILKISAAVPIIRILTEPYTKYITLHYYKKLVKVLVKFNSSTTKDEREKMKLARDDGQPKRIHHILWDEYRAGNLTKREVRANSMAVLVAGFETTATTSSYVLWCIAKHVSCKEKLRSDILNYGLESRYLDMFIKEVMRMYPALPNFVIRTPHMDTKLGGYTVKKGMSVYMSVNSIHYDETIWTNPYHFDPERFAEGKTYPPGAYAPFGLGHRMCAGYQLALREMKTIVCELLTNFDIQLIAPSEMITKCSSIFLTRPKNEIRLRLIPNAVIAKPSEGEETVSIKSVHQKPLSGDQRSTTNTEQPKQQSAIIESDRRSMDEVTSTKLLSEAKPIIAMRRATIIVNAVKSQSLREEDEEDVTVDRDDIGKRLSRKDSVKANRTGKISDKVSA